MNQKLIQRLNERIEAKSLLKHPFYQEWAAGKLTLEDLRRYAAQYYAFESNFPIFLSAIHSRCPVPEVRQVILSNLWDEEHGQRNHAALWIQFAEGLGMDKASVKRAEPYPETRRLVEFYRNIAAHASFQEGLAAVYAYESQVPQVATKKIEGLRQFYGFQDGKAMEFFDLHSSLDVEHSQAEALAVGEHTKPTQEPAVEAALEKALDSWWSFLDGVHRRK